MATPPSPAERMLAERVRAGDPDRYQAARFAEPNARAHLMTLYAFNLELAQSAWRASLRSSDPQIGAIRLRWWLDAIEEAYGGQPPRAHELAAPLAETIHFARPPKEALTRMVEARLRDLDPSPMASEAAFARYVSDTAGALTLAAAHVMVPERRQWEELDRVAEDLGFAIGAARVLEATPALAAHGRLLLPVMEPAARLACLRGETTPALRLAANRVAQEGLARLARARAARWRAPAGVAPAFLAAWRVERVLRIASWPDVDVFEDLRRESWARRYVGLAWRGLVGWW